MPKLKTKSSAKKRFSLTASGKVKFKRAYKRHGMRCRNQKVIRELRKGGILCEPDARIIRRTCNLSD